MGASVNEKDSVGQTALHYAVCHHFGTELVKILIAGGADTGIRRTCDGWTPLHLAAMFGKLEVAQILIEAGSNVSAKGSSGETPEDVAKKYRHHALADLLSSPRQEYRPKVFPSELEELSKKLESQSPDKPLKMTEALTSWRDEDGNTLLHLAAWQGNIQISRAFFDSVKGRKLVQVANNKGAVPLAMAIISGQDKMVEEFFMNKNAKKLIELGSSLRQTRENLVHLLLKYTPNVHPKFILKRKDLTKELLNSLDSYGETPLLWLARRNSSPSIRRILENKNVKENQLLDLSMKGKDGKTILHYLVEHRDEINFGLLLDRQELTPEVANISDKNGRSPLVTCLLEGSPYIARDILEHSTAKQKFRLDLCYTSDGRSPLHLVAEQGNGPLWQLAVTRPDCDMNARDACGNTPLMRAALCGRAKMLETFLNDSDRARQVDMSLVNDEGKTLLMLIVEHIQDLQLLKKFLKTVNAQNGINQSDKNQQTALTIAAKLQKWTFVKELMTNLGLKIGDPLHEETLEGTVDVHPLNSDGYSVLTMLVLTRIKLARQEQTFMMKKQRNNALEAKKEQESLWELIKLILVREKEQHGTSMTQGRDGGSECIKAQLGASKLIRQPNVDEVIQQFTKQYQFIKRRKPPLPSSQPAQAPQRTTSTSEGSIPVTTTTSEASTASLPITSFPISAVTTSTSREDTSSCTESPSNVATPPVTSCASVQPSKSDDTTKPQAETEISSSDTQRAEIVTEPSSLVETNEPASSEISKINEEKIQDKIIELTESKTISLTADGERNDESEENGNKSVEIKKVEKSDSEKVDNVGGRKNDDSKKLPVEGKIEKSEQKDELVPDASRVKSSNDKAPMNGLGEDQPVAPSRKFRIGAKIEKDVLDHGSIVNEPPQLSTTLDIPVHVSDSQDIQTISDQSLKRVDVGVQTEISSVTCCCLCHHN